MRPPAFSEHRPPKPSNIYRSGIAARVKWFNPDKGFGFVTPEDGSADAFLHASALRAAGHDTLPAGAAIVCDLAPGAKGPQVALIHEVTDPGPAPAAPQRGRGPQPGRPAPRPGSRSASQPGPRSAQAARAASPAARKPAAPAAPARLREFEGTVKFYSPEKGFGFVTPDRGTKDIFIHESALRRSGLVALQPRVRVRVYARETERGVEADRVEFL